MDKNQLLETFQEDPAAFITLLAAVVAVILGAFDLLSLEVMTKALFALVCALAFIEIVSRRKQLLGIQKSVDDSYASIERRLGVHLPRTIESGAAAHKYLSEQIPGSREIWHASVGPAYSPNRPAYKTRFDAALRAALANSDTNYRYVTTVHSPEKKARVDQLLGDPQIANAFVGTYENNDGFPPTIYFIVVDTKEVLVRCPHDYGEKDEYFLFDDPATVELFRKYHTLLWRGARQLNTEPPPEVALA